MTFWNSLNVFYFLNACQINSSSVSKPYYINLSMLNKGLYHGSRVSSSLLFFSPLLHPIFLIFFRFLDPPPHSLTANLLLENARQKRRLECYLPEVFSPQGVLSGLALKQVTPEKKTVLHRREDKLLKETGVVYLTRELTRALLT